jgi:hypothetical protein
MKYKIFLLPTHGRIFLYCTHIWQHTCLGGVLAYLHGSYNKITGFFYVLPVVYWRKLRNALLHSRHVAELGAVRKSEGLLHLLKLAFLSFRIILFRTFPHSLSKPPYGTPDETKLYTSLTAGSCYKAVSFIYLLQQLFLQRILHSN